DALLTGARLAMGTQAAPQILITIAARFGRTSWKYSSIAYALVLKDVGVLMQTFYLMVTDMELGGCAIGISNIDLFTKMTGIEFHVEGSVGQFALGREMKARSADAYREHWRAASTAAGQAGGTQEQGRQPIARDQSKLRLEPSMVARMRAGTPRATERNATAKTSIMTLLPVIFRQTPAPRREGHAQGQPRPV